MDYLYMNINQINNLDYWSLVNMLMVQITPETRKQILERLLEMNNQLIIGMNLQIQSDFSRSMVDSMKIMNVKDQFAMNNSYDTIPSMVSINNPYGTMRKYNVQQKESETEIDLDDIIDDIQNDQNHSLDAKLAKIKKLHSKIVTDKRRRKERQNT